MKYSYFKSILVLFILSIFTITPSSSLYFDFSDSEETCFYDDYYYQNAVIVDYSILGINENNTESMKLLPTIQIKLIRDDNNKVINYYALSKIKGKYIFNITDIATYRICAVSTKPRLLKGKEIFIKMNIDSDSAMDKTLENAIKQHDINPVAEKIEKIINKSKIIVEAQKQETEIEDTFSMIQMNYTVNFTIISIIQIVVVVIVGLYHIYSFKKFLYNNNLID